MNLFWVLRRWYLQVLVNKGTITIEPLHYEPSTIETGRGKTNLRSAASILETDKEHHVSYNEFLTYFTSFILKWHFSILECK